MQNKLINRSNKDRLLRLERMNGYTDTHSSDKDRILELESLLNINTKTMIVKSNEDRISILEKEYGTTESGPTVQIRYYTTDNAIEFAGIVAEGGTAELVKIEDNVYDLISEDALTFVALHAEDYTYYYYNYELNVSKIDVISGHTLDKFYYFDGSDIDVATFASFNDMSEFNWLDKKKNNPTSMKYFLADNFSLETLNFGTFNTSEVINFEYAFAGMNVAHKNLVLDLTSFDVSKATDMGGMFTKCDVVSIDMTGWDVSNVILFNSMFGSCSAQFDVSHFNTDSSTNMENMFGGISLSHVDLSSFNFDSLETSASMFKGSSNLECITNIDTTSPSLTNKIQMFDNCPLLVQPTAGDITTITSGGGMDWTNPGECPSA